MYFPKLKYISLTFLVELGNMTPSSQGNFKESQLNTSYKLPSYESHLTCFPHEVSIVCYKSLIKLDYWYFLSKALMERRHRGENSYIL